MIVLKMIISSKILLARHDASQNVKRSRKILLEYISKCSFQFSSRITKTIVKQNRTLR